MTAGPSVPAPPAALRAIPPPARLAALADAGTLVAFPAAGASPHLARFGIAAQDDDGVQTAALAVKGRRVLAAAQDDRFLGGSVGQRHGEALERLFRQALADRPAAVVLLVASGGVRLHEANAAELALARALRALLDARAAGIPVVAIATGSVFGGASILACAAERLAMLPDTLIGLSGPKVIETARGRAELDAADLAAVAALFGAKARADTGAVDALTDDAEALRAWVIERIAMSRPFDVAVRHEHAALREGIAWSATTADLEVPDVLHAAAHAVDAGGWLFLAGGVHCTRPFTGAPFAGAAVHALDEVLLDAADAKALTTLVITEDSAGHEVSRAAEARFESRWLAHHAAVLAYLRTRGVREIGLLCGSGHSAAFFVNALQAPVLYAQPEARVVAMEPAAIARVTGHDVDRLLEDDPLLGQPARHLEAHGGVAGIVPGIAALLAGLRQ